MNLLFKKNAQVYAPENLGKKRHTYYRRQNCIDGGFNKLLYIAL